MGSGTEMTMLRPAKLSQRGQVLLMLAALGILVDYLLLKVAWWALFGTFRLF